MKGTGDWQENKYPSEFVKQVVSDIDMVYNT